MTYKAMPIDFMKSLSIQHLSGALDEHRRRVQKLLHLSPLTSDLVYEIQIRNQEMADIHKELVSRRKSTLSKVQQKDPSSEQQFQESIIKAYEAGVLSQEEARQMLGTEPTVEMFAGQKMVVCGKCNVKFPTEYHLFAIHACKVSSAAASIADTFKNTGGSIRQETGKRPPESKAKLVRKKRERKIVFEDQ